MNILIIIKKKIEFIIIHKINDNLCWFLLEATSLLNSVDNFVLKVCRMLSYCRVITNR